MTHLQDAAANLAPLSNFPPLLEVVGLESRYDRAQVLFGVSLSLARGEVVAVIGRNGAGKSTLFKSLIGLLRPAAGKVLFDGQPVQNWPPYRIARAGIGYVPEERRIFADLTVLDNLETGRQAPRSGLPAWTIARVVALFPELDPLLSRVAGTLSGGEQQMLSLGRTLMGNPRLLLLDEPGEGLAPTVLARMTAALQTIAADGVSILVSDQSPSFGKGVVQRAYRLERGRISALEQGGLAA